MYMNRDMEAAVMLLNQVILDEMGEHPRNSPENDEIFEKYLVSLEKEYMLTIPETYIVGKVSEYPANWVTWRTIANGRYRKAFEALREGRMRKKEILKKIVKKLVSEAAGEGMGTSDPSGLGQSTDTSVKAQVDAAKLAQKYDELDKKARRLNLMSKERAALEDERMKVWWELRKILKQKGLSEDHGLGFSHNVSIPQDQNTMNKSTIKEYNDPNSRARAIESSNFDRGIALLYKWAESGVIDFKEFRFLLTHFVQKFK